MFGNSGNLTTIGGPWYFWYGRCPSKAHKPVTLSRSPKKISLQPQEKKCAGFFFYFFLNWDFDLEISQLIKKRVPKF